MARNFTFVRPQLALAAVVLTALGWASPSGAQIQTSDQRDCILGMNRAAEGVGAALRSQVQACVKAAQTGLLAPGTTVADCITTPGSKLQAAIDKAYGEDVKSCGDVPDFGYTNAEDVVNAVLDQELSLAADIFGYETSGAIRLSSVDRNAAKCQAAVAKDYRKVVGERVRAFIDCKTDGLRSGGIHSTATLQACFDAIQNDSQGRINKAFLKLAKDVVKRCQTSVFDDVFPGACTGSADFVTCLQTRVACRNCIALNAVDGVMESCDDMDNGEVDRSCVDPRANECAGENGGDDCDVNATCTDQYDGFDCTCVAGYHGDGVTCTDDNECNGQGSGDNCSANATCTNTAGSFTCACNAGYHGDGVTCADDNECTGQGSGNNCSANGSCHNTAGSFTCSCNAGYAGNGVTCGDVNECVGEGGGNNCSANGSCTNTVGSFSCSCNAGYTGNGVSCTDLNECAGQNGGHNCSANGSCTNVPGSFTCSCNAGYHGNGVTCADDNECVGEGSGNECSANGSCTNTPGGYTCACNAHYSGNGFDCVDQDECAGEGTGNNCSVNANCTNTPGSFTCACEPGYDGNAYGSTCNSIEVDLTAPVHGSFTTASSVTATGHVTAASMAGVTLMINGSACTTASGCLQSNGNFSKSVTLTPSIIFNGIRAEVTQNSTGFKVRDRRVVIWGNSVNMGANVAQSVGLRITDTGFNALEPVLTGGVNINVATLVPAGTTISNDCTGGFLETCNEAYIKSASSGSVGLDVNSQTNYVDGLVKVNTVRVDLDVYTKILGVRTHCDSFYITMDRVDVLGAYTLSPDSVDASYIDVNLSPNVNTISTINFVRHVACGGTGFQTAIINAFGGDTEQQVKDGLANYLKDPDGAAAAQDAPIAQLIEDALGDITLAAPLGAAFGVNLATPLFSVPEDVNGVTLGSNATMTTLNPVVGAPQFTKTLVVASTFPQTQLANATAPGGHSYGMALAINDTAFNQILAAQVMRGLLQSEISSISLVDGQPPTNLTAGLLSIFIPEFAQLDPDLPLRIKIRPTLAPALTGQQGQNGELAEMIISHLIIEVVSGPTNSPTVWGEIATDMLTSFDMVIGSDGKSLQPLLGTPVAADISITLLGNPLGADETNLAAVLPSLLIPVVPSLSSLLGAFPLPAFLGLLPTPVEISRVGPAPGFMGVYMNVTAAP